MGLSERGAGVPMSPRRRRRRRRGRRRENPTAPSAGEAAETAPRGARGEVSAAGRLQRPQHKVCGGGARCRSYTPRRDRRDPRRRLSLPLSLSLSRQCGGAKGRAVCRRLGPRAARQAVLFSGPTPTRRASERASDAGGGGGVASRSFEEHGDGGGARAGSRALSNNDTAATRKTKTKTKTQKGAR